jgi:hypothetical protein
MESPKNTIAVEAGFALVSILLRNRRDEVVLSALKFAALVTSPPEMNPVCLPFQCTEATADFWGKYKLTASVVSGFTARSTGSLIKGAPGGITAQLLPPKDSTFTVAGSTALPPVDRATVADPTVNGLPPNSLEITTRT